MKNSKRELILTALLSNPTIREASTAIGVPEQTIYTWLRKPDFKQEYDERRRHLVDDASNYLQIKLSEATGTIFGIMNDEETPSQTRLNAARTVFEYCHKFIEQREIIDRLSALEALASEDNER